MTGIKVIDEYIALVRSGDYPACKEQYQLCDFVERIFETEDLNVDEKRLTKYLSYEKYFPFELFPWEKFVFSLHNCVYREDGSLRFPVALIFVGRGAGKNGYLAFEDFGLITDTNGIPKYHIDIFATGEDQAKQSFDDVYDVLETHKPKMKLHFHWTKEVITNTDTGSKLRFRTSNHKTKDGGRPGKIDHDEYHAYEDYKLIAVSTTGLGKTKDPRRTITTTDGDVRGGPLDELIETCEQILDGSIPDNGILPFMCRLDDPDEVYDEKMWHKANPSLRYLPNLLQEMRLEFQQYLQNPAANTAFMTKRMNRPPKFLENGVTSWENIKATNVPIPEKEIFGRSCVAGIDYMKTTDFLGAGLLWRVGDKDIWISHTWICSKSADLNRIKAPLREWEARGMVTFVDAPEIPPELPCIWLATEAAKRKSQIILACIDDYRYALMRKALLDINFSADKEYSNVRLIRPREEMRNIPLITSKFVNHNLIWGDSPMMRWACNNAKTVTSPQGNTTYGKIEPKSRKTDTFKAFVAAECGSEILDNFANQVVTKTINTGVYIFG